jgi:hypothetical protein
MEDVTAHSTYHNEYVLFWRHSFAVLADVVSKEDFRARFVCIKSHLISLFVFHNG